MSDLEDQARPRPGLQLQLAREALANGQFGGAHELAQAAARAAEATGDVQTHAHALIFIAELQAALSRHRDANDASQRAAFLCESVGDRRGEAMALMLVGHTAANLGRNEDAIEAALLSVKLLEALPLDPTRVIALTILGSVYMWGRDWKRARHAFDAAIDVAGHCEPKVEVAYAVLNGALAEILKHVYDRADQDGAPSSIEGQEALARRIEQAIGSAPGMAPTPTGQDFFESLWHVCQTIVAIWLGQTLKAEQLMDAARLQLGLTPKDLWRDFWHEWTRLELAWQRGNYPAAERAAEKGLRIAVACENEQLACCALISASKLAELQGDTTRSLKIQKRLRVREWSIRTEAIRSRERVVQWQLDMRQKEASLKVLEVRCLKLEQLSLEDPLTGIANRRGLELGARAMLDEQGSGGLPLCLAFFDVDYFKVINDRYSHQVGDRVLQRVARILSANVRENDIAARLAGDEFVVALRYGAEVASLVCERIRASVAQFDWSSVVPGLSATISVGVVQSQPGDTVETWLHRGDLAMYANKRSGGAR